MNKEAQTYSVKAGEIKSDSLFIFNESQRQFSTILTNLEMIVIMIDLDGNIAFCNDYLLRLSGWEHHETIGQNWFDMFLPEHEQQRVRSLLDEVSPTSSINPHFINEIRTRSGEHRLVRWTNTSLSDPDGKIIGFVGLGNDITDCHRVKKALKKSEERYRDLVENARDIIYTHDLDGNYTSINLAGEQITGYTRQETLQMNITQTVAPEYLDKAYQMIAKKISGEKDTAYELEIISKNNRRIAVEVNTKLIYQDNTPVCIQGIARDITERKQLEAQLQQSQKLEAIGQLAGGIAHDFNNMLTAITGYSNLGLRKINPDNPLRHTFEEINKAGARAASLTRQLLAFSRKQILQPRVLNLNTVVSDLEKMLSWLIGENIDLRTSLEPKLGMVEADPGQIEQVIMNLVINARDAMLNGGILTIETFNIHLEEEIITQDNAIKPNSYVMLIVSDTGTGMSDEIKQHMFEPFFTTKEVGQGTGLGLATVYGIVKQSGGYIWVYSEPGVGTTFKIYLPMVGEKIVSGKTPETKRVLEPVRPFQGTETILLAEDEEIVRKLISEELRSYGYHVLEAENGEKALFISEQYKEPIHLLMTDVVMPVISGHELAERITQFHPKAKTLYMSGYTNNSIVHHGILDSDVTFIQKPFTTNSLLRKVREVLGSDK